MCSETFQQQGALQNAKHVKCTCIPTVYDEMQLTFTQHACTAKPTFNSSQCLEIHVTSCTACPLAL